MDALLKGNCTTSFFTSGNRTERKMKMVVETIYNGKVIDQETYYTKEQARKYLHAERRKAHMERRKERVEMIFQKMLGLLFLILGFITAKMVMGDPTDAGGQILFFVAGFIMILSPKSLKYLTEDYYE